MNGAIFVLTIAALVAVGYLVFRLSAFQVVQPDAAVVDRWGEWVRVIRRPGLKFMIPLIEKAVIVPGRPQQLDLGEEVALTADGFQVTANGHCWYRVRALQDVNGIIMGSTPIKMLVLDESAVYFYADQIGSDDRVREFLTPLMKAAYDKVIAQFNGANLHTNQDIVEDSVVQILNLALEQQGWGAIVVTRVGFENLRATAYAEQQEANQLAEMNKQAAVSKAQGYALGYNQVKEITKSEFAAKAYAMKESLPEGTQLNLYNLGSYGSLLSNLLGGGGDDEEDDPASQLKNSVQRSVGKRPRMSRPRRRRR